MSKISKKADFMLKFSEYLNLGFENLLQEYNLDNNFQHNHALIHINSLTPNAQIIKNSSSIIINISNISSININFNKIFEYAGAGLVFIINNEQATKANLSSYLTNPNIFDKHMDKTWDEWIRTLNAKF